MPGVLNILEGPSALVAAMILSTVLASLAVILTVALRDARKRLAEAERRADDIAIELEQVTAELALVRERLDQTRRAAGRAQAEAADREVRLKALLAVDRRAVESRVQTANRVIEEALREQASYSPRP